MNRTALLIIDVQRGAFDGELIAPIDRPDTLVRNAASLLEAARASRTSVVFVQHCEGPGELFTRGTAHWEFHEALVPRSGEVVVEKSQSSAFADTTLQRELEAVGAKALVLCGLQSEFCVSNTATAALSSGYSVTIAEDAHSTWPSGEQTARDISEAVNRALRAQGAALASTAALVRSLRDAEA